MTKTNFVGLVNPTYNNAFTMEHTNRSITHNDLITWSLDHLVTSKPLRGFTMAEILLSLTIIGVVAAITLPSLMANINERTWNTQRKALYARMSQAIAMMPQVGGYGTLTEDENGSITTDSAAEAFLTEGLSKVLKINNICDSEHLADCGVPTSFTNLAGTTKTWPKILSAWNSKFVNFSFVGSGWSADGTDIHYSYSQIDTKAAAFETQSGESVAVYYNPYCSSDVDVYHYVQKRMCANFIYDLNGNKGPNTVGKDIGFITALNNNSPSIVAPMPLTTNAANNAKVTHQDASAACTLQDVESRLPNKDELASMFYNNELVGISTIGVYLTGSVGSSDRVWNVNFNMGDSAMKPRIEPYYARCVRR